MVRLVRREISLVGHARPRPATAQPRPRQRAPRPPADDAIAPFSVSRRGLAGNRAGWQRGRSGSREIPGFERAEAVLAIGAPVREPVARLRVGLEDAGGVHVSRPAFVRRTQSQAGEQAQGGETCTMAVLLELGISARDRETRHGPRV